MPVEKWEFLNTNERNTRDLNSAEWLGRTLLLSLQLCCTTFNFHLLSNCGREAGLPEFILKVAKAQYHMAQTPWIEQLLRYVGYIMRTREEYLIYFATTVFPQPNLVANSWYCSLSPSETEGLMFANAPLKSSAVTITWRLSVSLPFSTSATSVKQACRSARSAAPLTSAARSAPLTRY